LAEISFPDGRLASRFAIVTGWLPAAYAGLLPILFIPVSVDAYILPRSALTIFLGTAIFCAGLLFGERTLGGLRWPALAVALAALLAFAFSFSPALSLAGEYSRYESLPVRLAYLALLCGAAWIGERRRLVACFLIGCSIASVEAVLQWATGSLARPDGNLGQANLLGALLAMALPLALDRARWSPWWLVPAGLAALGLIASSSRSGWLAALVGLLVVGVFRVSARRLRPVLWVSAAALVAALVVGVFSPLRSLNQDTGSGRFGIWRDSLSMIASRPLLGWGEDAFGAVFGRFQTGDWSPGQSIDRAHSMPLDLLATQGVVGLACCAWLFFVVWRGLWRRPSLAGPAGALAAYLAWSVLNFDWAPATGAAWLLAGAAFPAPDRSHGPRAAAARWTWVATVLALLTALGLAAPAQLADIWLYSARPDRAAALDPLQPRYQAARGGLAGLSRAADLHDPDPTTYLRLGDELAGLGRRAEARAAYERALLIYPFYAEARQRLAAAQSSPKT
jgi:O-antigen ligase